MQRSAIKFWRQDVEHSIFLAVVLTVSIAIALIIYRNVMFEHITLPNNVLPPVAPYSHAVRAGDFLFVTGQLAEDPKTGEVVRGTIEEQTQQVMENLKLVLDHVGAAFEQVAMARIFITDFRFYEAVNRVYSSYFTTEKLPCRTTVGVIALAGYGDVEIDLVVYCGE